MAIIKQERVFSLNTDIEFKSISHSFIMNSAVMLNPIIPPSDKDMVLLVVKFKVEPYISPPDVKLETELVLPFTITDIEDITIQDLFSCVQSTERMMQSIFDCIFLGKARLIVPPMEFEKIEPKLISHLKDIKQG